MRVIVKDNNKGIRINPVTHSIEIRKDGEFVKASEVGNSKITENHQIGIGFFEPIILSIEEFSNFMLKMNEEQIPYKCEVIRKNNKYYVL